MSRRVRVTLVGPVMQENLALQYLSAVVEARGHVAASVGYDNREQLGRAIEGVARSAPDLVGIAVPFQHCIADAFALASGLRRAGVRAHITCGGHVPTFCFTEMLRDCPALDSVVRHEAEETLAEMLDAVAEERPVRDLAGLVWREGDEVVVGARREPVRQLDTITPPSRPAEPYRVAGVPVAFVITARGCIGECEYCCIRAFGRDAGGPPFRLRAPEAVADEIAAIHLRVGARIFFVQDDIFVLPSEPKTIARMDAIADALARRGVRDIAFWIKGRPETITPAVLEAARRMGAIHMFLGVESASAERLAYLGRLHRPDDNQRAIERCREHGVHPSWNLMLFDPDCTMADVLLTLRFAEEHIGAPYNFCRTEIYSGTGLSGRLAREGRLLGDYRSYGYVMRDARAELMFRILRVCLHERAFAFDSLLNKLISLSFARQIHTHLFPGSRSASIDREVQTLIETVHRDTLDMLLRAHERASIFDLADERAIRAYTVSEAIEASRRDLEWHARAQKLWDMLNVIGAHRMGGTGARSAGERDRAPILS